MSGIPQDSRSPFQQLRLIEFVNVGASEIPAFGAVEITGVSVPESGSDFTPGGGRVVMQVRRPTCDSSPRIMFNLANPVAVGKYGIGTNEFPCWALADTTANGDRVGSAEDSYVLEKGKSGFVVAGGSYGGATRIVRPTNEIAFYEGELLSNLCSGAGQADGLTRVGSCCDVDNITGTVDLNNKYNFKACAGDPFLAMKVCSESGDDEYRIVAIYHQTKEVLVTSPYYYSCSLRFPKVSTSIQHCCPAADEDVLTMYEHVYLADVKINKTGGAPGTVGTAGGSQVCELQLQNSVGRFCAFTPFDPDDLLDVYSPIVFEPLHVVVDVADDGTCVQKTRQWVYVLCWDDEDAPEDVLCLEECTTGSA